MHFDYISGGQGTEVVHECSSSTQIITSTPSTTTMSDQVTDEPIPNGIPIAGICLNGYLTIM